MNYLPNTGNYAVRQVHFPSLHLVEHFDYPELTHRHIHGDPGQQIEYASNIGMMEVRSYSV